MASCYPIHFPYEVSSFEAELYATTLNCLTIHGDKPYKFRIKFFFIFTSSSFNHLIGDVK